MTKKPFVSALMSVYHKESPVFLRESLLSVFRQTRPVDELVLVADGPLTDGLYRVLDELKEEDRKLLRLIPLEKNLGLGLALRRGVEECRGDLIFRMDTDDIADPLRLEKELHLMEENPALDGVGSYIAEFEDDLNHVMAVREVPLSEDGIRKYQRKRSALNHVSVLLKRESILRAGNYEDALYMEDDMLWHNMLQSGAAFRNIPESLVFVRVGQGFVERRGGSSYLSYYKAARKKMLKRGQISYGDYAVTVAAQCLTALLPAFLRRLFFHRILRGRKDDKSLKEAKKRAEELLGSGWPDENKAF